MLHTQRLGVMAWPVFAYCQHQLLLHLSLHHHHHQAAWCDRQDSQHQARRFRHTSTPTADEHRQKQSIS
jgi:hypothetical protein